MSEQTAAGSQPAGETGQTVQSYLDALASSAPTPGGGSAAGLTGALGAALVSMVANLTLGRPKFAAVAPQMEALLDGAERARVRLIDLAAADEQAYAAFSRALKRPRRTEAEQRARAQALQAARREAASPPLAMAQVCRHVLELARTAGEVGNPSLASDAGVAALLAEAALRASAINVRVNLVGLDDREFVTAAESELARLLDEAAPLKESIVATASRRMAGG